MTEQQQHPSSSNVSLLDTFPEGKYLFETWLADAVQAYRRASFGDAVSTSRERFLAQLVADKAAQWAWDQREPEIQAAADAELEACCEWFAGARIQGIGNNYGKFISTKIRAARRPKPPSLKEQALGLFKHRELHRDMVFNPQDVNTILHALEALPDG
jgi:hypothetical protein